MFLGQDINVSFKNYIGFKGLECRDDFWAIDVNSVAISLLGNAAPPPQGAFGNV